MDLSAQAYDRILKIAHTVTDLNGLERNTYLVHIIFTGKVFVTLGKMCSKNCTKSPEYQNLATLNLKCSK